MLPAALKHDLGLQIGWQVEQRGVLTGMPAFF